MHHPGAYFHRAGMVREGKNVFTCFVISKGPYKCCYTIKSNIFEDVGGHPFERRKGNGKVSFVLLCYREGLGNNSHLTSMSHNVFKSIWWKHLAQVSESSDLKLL